MADLKVKHLEDQLKRIGCNFRFWGRAELRELANILLPEEVVEHCVNGQYEGGFALLAATNQRVLLIDKKPMYLTLEDIRFDMISEIDFNHRLLDATVFICTPNKSLRFTAYNQGRLRKLFQFTQTQVMEIRQHYQHQNKIWKDYAARLQSKQPEEPSFTAGPTESSIPAIEAPQQLPLEISSLVPESSPAAQLEMPQPPMPLRTVAPIISAYTRLPMMSRQRRFLGSRAVNTPMPPAYGGQ